MNDDLDALIARARVVSQSSRATNLAGLTGDRVASVAAAEYNQYNVLTLKKAHKDWMAGAPRTLDDLLNTSLT